MRRGKVKTKHRGGGGGPLERARFYLINKYAGIRRERRNGLRVHKWLSRLREAAFNV